jgi:hypothetical protein
MLEGRETIDKPEEVYIRAMRVSVPGFCGFKGRNENGS